jgi:uncharacterized protein YggE
MRMVFLSALIILFGCQQTERPARSNRTISVIGIGKSKVLPDQVEVTIKAEFTRPAMKLAVTETQATMDEVLKVAKKYVKESFDIKTSSISSNKDYEYSRDKRVFKGYQASQSVDITLKDISRFEKFTEEMLATRISQIENLTFSHSKKDSILREVDLLAIDDAHHSALKICERTQVKLGKILKISNYGPQVDDGDNIYSEAPSEGLNVYAKAMRVRGFQISPEILEFSKAAFITYEIE